MFAVSTASLWIAGYYTWATSLSNTDPLMNIVGILYILDVDESAFGFARGAAPQWHDEIVDEIVKELDGSKENDLAEEKKDNKETSVPRNDVGEAEDVSQVND